MKSINMGTKRKRRTTGEEVGACDGMSGLGEDVDDGVGEPLGEFMEWDEFAVEFPDVRPIEQGDEDGPDLLDIESAVWLGVEQAIEDLSGARLERLSEGLEGTQTPFGTHKGVGGGILKGGIELRLGELAQSADVGSARFLLISREESSHKSFRRCHPYFLQYLWVGEQKKERKEGG